eukprot:67830-Rhodomonas_salina.1
MQIEGSPTQQHHVQTYGADFAYGDFAAQFERECRAPSAFSIVAVRFKRRSTVVCGVINVHMAAECRGLEGLGRDQVGEAF